MRDMVFLIFFFAEDYGGYILNFQRNLFDFSLNFLRIIKAKIFKTFLFGFMELLNILFWGLWQTWLSKVFFQWTMRENFTEILQHFFRRLGFFWKIFEEYSCHEFFKNIFKFVEFLKILFWERWRKRHFYFFSKDYGGRILRKFFTYFAEKTIVWAEIFSEKFQRIMDGRIFLYEILKYFSGNYGGHGILKFFFSEDYGWTMDFFEDYFSNFSEEYIFWARIFFYYGLLNINFWEQWRTLHIFFSGLLSRILQGFFF